MIVVCCQCWRKRREKEADDKNREAILVDLIRNPYKVSQNLDQLINDFEEATNSYRKYRTIYIDYHLKKQATLHDDVANMITLLQNDIGAFHVNTQRAREVDAVDPDAAMYSLTELIRRRDLVSELEAQFISKSESSDSPHAVDVNLNIDNEGEKVSDKLPVGKMISELWATRLNRVNFTQGAIELNSTSSW